MRVMMKVGTEGELSQMTLTLSSARRRPDRLNPWDRQRDQYTDDAQRHNQFQKCQSG